MHNVVSSSFTVGSTQGVQIAGHDFGGDGPLLVLAHATGFHGMVWTPLAKLLSDRFHCVSFDFRGHGKSRLVDGADLAWRSFGDDLIAVIDHLSPDQPVRVAGHSMGGAAIAFAASKHPERFVSAWAFEPILYRRVENRPPSPISEGARKRRADFASRDEAFANYKAKPPLNLLTDEALRCYVDHGFDDTEDGITISCRPETEAQVYENASCGGDEAAVAMTVRFGLAAGSDGRGPGDLARDVAPRADHLTLIETDLTHFGPLENPEFVAEEIRRWFAADD